MKILFFHGGPGLNSNPENRLLSGRFADAGYKFLPWNEPSKLRPQGPAPVSGAGAYTNYLACAESFFLSHYEGAPLALMAHSFGAHPACYLAERHAEKLAKIIFIASDLAVETTDLNQFRFAMLDFKKNGDSRYLELQKVVDGYSGKFDRNAEDGFNLFVQNPNWFDYYWFNKDRKRAFEAHYQEPGFTVDVDSFFEVRRAFASHKMAPSRVPAAAIFGKHDVVVTKDAELALLKERFQSLSVHQCDGSAHYPHIEEPDQVFRVLAKELAKELA